MQLFDAQFEVDPEKMSEDADANLNVVLLQLMCQKFVTQITRSVAQCPWLKACKICLLNPKGTSCNEQAHTENCGSKIPRI